MKRIILVLALMLVTSSPSLAQTPSSGTDIFVHGTFNNVVDTLIRFGAISIKEDRFIDDYTFLTACAEFYKYNDNEFRWRDVRKIIRQRIREQVALFPTAYSYDASIKLDQYNFKEKLFKFVEANAIKNVNSFVVYSATEAFCADKEILTLPRNYRVVLDKPIYVLGLPLNEQEAEQLLARMTAASNTDRKIYVRFNMRLFYVAPLSYSPTKNKFHQPADNFSDDGVTNVSDSVRLDARLDSVDFYEDEAKTRLLYSYREGGLM